MSDFKEFMMDSALPIEAETVGYTASKRFRGADGKPIEWRLRAITTEQDEALRQGAKKRTLIPGTREAKTEIDYDTYISTMVCACVVHPNLNDAELQTSYGAVGAADLLRKMLTPGEYSDLALAVQQNNGFDAGMADKIKRVKN